MQTEQPHQQAELSCLSCGSADIIPIAYGLPGAKTLEAASQGLVKLGGCVIDGDAPATHACKACGREFRTDQ